MARTSTHPALSLIRIAALFAVAASSALGITYFARDTTFCGADGGCAAVSRAIPYTDLLPLVGLIGFTTLFATSLFTGRTPRRLTALMAIVAGIAGAGLLLLQAVVVQRFCWLCVVTDTAAVVASGAGIWLLRSLPLDEPSSSSIASFWWVPFPIALLGPFVLAFTVAVPDEVLALHNEEADVTVVEMADFECPYCRALHPVLQQAIEESGHHVHLERVVVPLAFHTHARDAAKAYFCVGEERADEMADRLFAADDLSMGGLRHEAEAMGMSGDAFDRCMDDPATEERVEEDEARARNAGMQGLPTVYIGTDVLVGFDAEQGSEPYAAAIEAAASGRGNRYRPWPALFMFAGVAIALITAWRRRTEAARASEATPEATRSSDE